MPTPGVEEVQICKRALLAVVTEQHVPLLEALRTVSRVMRSQAAVDLAYREILAEMEANLGVDSAVTDSSSYSSSAWYVEPARQQSWDYYVAQLEASRAPALDDLARETRQIVSLIADPNVPGSRRKGLVMGNVQSGKTRNFAGVAARAADVGYKFVIVLAGMHDNLRDQTQSRLDRQLFDGDRWYPVTSVGQDFVDIIGPEQVLQRMDVVAAVVKKNTHRLERLIDTLGRVPVQARRRLPILIIDDEADQATPNSLAQHARISAINGQLRRLWKLVETGTYVAYTATPFANVLMNPDEMTDLFPSDFITTIPPGDGYFGAARVFGISETVDDQGNGTDGLNVVRKIETTEAATLRAPSDRDAREAFDPEPPPSLLRAFRWFVVATAIRWARGQKDHSSMLVHTTHYTAPHRAMCRRLENLVERSLEEVARGDLSSFESAWKAESDAVVSEATVPLPPWADVAARLEQVLVAINVIMDNGASSDRLNYEGPEPRTVIAVGGGTLSRGLTLEGLIVSYFTRTSNAYDTLLQMGRWFGYRTGYEDLPRVWVTEGLDKDYAFLARVEQDLRAEIESVQGSEFTPAQVGIRVRAHPGRLQVTAANRMWSASVVQLGLSETSNQTFILSAFDTERNLAAAERLLGGLDLVPLPWQPSRRIARDVDGTRVTAFLGDFAVHRDQKWLADNENLANIQRWIDTNASGPVWNVVLAGNSRATAPDGVTPLGSMTIGGTDLACLNRAPMLGSSPERLDFKAIASPDDRIGDIDPATYAGVPHAGDAQRRRIRRQGSPDRGLLVLYPISSESRASLPPPGEPPSRMDMPIEDNLLGFSIFFPAVNDTTGDEGTYVSVRRTWEVADVAEGDEEDLAENDSEDQE